MSAVDRAALATLHRSVCVDVCPDRCDGHKFPRVCAGCGVPWPCTTGALLAALDAAERRVAELEVALEPDGARRLELAKKLAISASNLLRIERDEARARAAAHETDAANLEDRVAELEGLLVQAEDYARDAADAAAVDTADSTTRIERSVEQDDGAGGRIVRGPAGPDMPQSLLDGIVRRNIGNPKPVWRRVTTDRTWRTGTPPEAGR